MRRSLHLVGAFVVACVCASSTAAQTTNRHRHDGFWIAFSLGASGLSSVEGRTDNDVWSGAGGGGFLTAGGTLSQRLLIGGEMLTGFRFEIAPPDAAGNDPQATVITISPVVQFYPLRNRGFYLSGGPALGVSSITGGGRLIEAPGAGLTLGVGYDLRFGGRFALTPNVRFVQLFSSMTHNETGAANERVPENPQLFFMGTALSWY